MKTLKEKMPIYLCIIEFVVIIMLIGALILSYIFQPDYEAPYCAARNVFWFSSKEEILKRENISFEEKLLTAKKIRICKLLISEQPVNYFGYDATLVYLFHEDDRMVQMNFLIDCTDHNEYSIISENLIFKLRLRYECFNKDPDEADKDSNIFFVNRKNMWTNESECVEHIRVNSFHESDYIFSKIFGEKEYEEMKNKYYNTVVVSYNANPETYDFFWYRYYQALYSDAKNSGEN